MATYVSLKVLLCKQSTQHSFTWSHLRWFGHLIGMSPGPRFIVQARPTGRRTRGRPRTYRNGTPRGPCGGAGACHYREGCLGFSPVSSAAQDKQKMEVFSTSLTCAVTLRPLLGPKHTAVIYLWEMYLFFMTHVYLLKHLFRAVSEPILQLQSRRRRCAFYLAIFFVCRVY